MLGNNLKKLREKKGLSQTALSEVLHVSPQAISKWENGVSDPDIEMLPKIASFFGSTIDELFDYDKALEYERIDKAIENGYTLDNGLFESFENFLLKEIALDPNDHRPISTIADLYLFHACRLKEKAIAYAYQALNLKKDNVFDLNTLNNASNGVIEDYNISCHNKLIAKLYSLNGGPHTISFLIRNLIADHRLDEAKALLCKCDEADREYYEVRIKEAEDGFKACIDDYKKLYESDNWLTLLNTANRFSKHHAFKEAIPYYQKAHELCPRPRYTDMLASLAYISENMGESEEAIKYFKAELKLLKDEWQITKGEQTEAIKKNIERLKK